MKYALTDTEVRGVMSSLRSLKFHTLEEIVEEYYQIYPPALPPNVKKKGALALERTYAFLMQKQKPSPPLKDSLFIRKILKFLEESNLVRSEVFTFDAEPIPPTKKYTLTNAGINFIFGRR